MLFYSFFFLAAFEFLAEQEAVMRGTTNTTYRLVFVFATLCRRHCGGAFSSSLIQQHVVFLSQVVSAVLVLQCPKSHAYDPQKRVYLSEHMKDNFLPQICIQSPCIKHQRAQHWNTKSVCWCRVVGKWPEQFLPCRCAVWKMFFCELETFRWLETPLLSANLNPLVPSGQFL